LVFLSALDALGVERNNGLSIRSCGLQGNDPCPELVFLWVGELEGVAAKGGATPCATRRDTALRTGPQVDNSPQESGMGFDWPGNLYQMLAKGSTGWRLDKTHGSNATSWSLVVFPAPPVQARDQDPKQISIPKLARRLPLPGDRPTTDLLVGWIKTTDLSEP
jgi:hypothetical protein